MKCKRWLSGLVAAAMLSTMTAGLPAVSAEETLPDPDYLFTFEETDGTAVANSGSEDASATLQGSASVTTDTAVPNSDGSSSVLRLNGSSAGSAYLDLPERIFSDVNGTDGVTLTMWVKPSTYATAYMKIFDASAVELGSTYAGNDDTWSDPDFALAVGGEVYDATFYIGDPNENADVTCKINYSTHLQAGEWQMLTVTMTSSEYCVYINGQEISYSDAQQGTGTVEEAMAALFENDYIQSLTYSALGRSYYTSDNDFRGSIDDFGVYTQALTADQVKALYDSYDIPEDTGEGAVASFDMSNESTLSQSATGFLYGTSEINVPSISLVEGLSPTFLVQKAMDGQQHPSGDAVRTSSALEAAGVEAIQVYLQDYYLEWPYDAPTTDDGSIDIDSYQATVESILYKMICDEASEGDEGAFLGSDGNWYVLNEEEASLYNYVLFNEPDTIWFGDYQMDAFCAAWEQIYDAIHAIDPNAKCAGPNTTNYCKSWNEDFFAYCYEHDCLPEIVTWHELYDGGNLADSNDPNDEEMTGDSTLTFYNHCLDMTALLSQYYPADEMPQLLVNEYALADDIGSPGRLVKWMSMLEDWDVSGCMAYWGMADTLNEMAADQFNPNSTWWLYHWYSLMTGTQRAYIFDDNPDATIEEKAEAFYNMEDTYYGLTSYDEDNNIAYTLFGGSTLETSETVKLTNMDATNLEGENGAVYVQLYGVGYSGQLGVTSQPQLLYEGPVQVVNDTVTIIATDTDEMDAYFAVVTTTDQEARDTVATGSISTLSYEAEDATLLGGATAASATDWATSGRALVNNILNDGDGVQFTVNVEESGVYELSLFYCLQAPYVDAETLEPDASGQNRAIGQTLPFGMQVDDQDQEVLYLESTVKYDYKTHYDVDVYLTAGEHTITFTQINGDQTGLGNLQLTAYLDKLDLNFVGVAGTTEIASDRYDFSVSLYQESRKSTDAAVSAQSLQTNTGNQTTFTAVAPLTGYYQVSVQLEDWIDSLPTLNLSLQGIDYAADADSYSTVSTYFTQVGSASPTASGEVVLGTVYLPQGASTMMLETASGDAVLGDLTFTYVGDSDNVTSIDASELTIYGTNAYLEEQEYAQSSDGLVLTELGIGQDVTRSDLTDEENKELAESNYAEITITADTAGVYSLGITYSNDEPAPVMLKSDGTTYVHPYNVDLVERYMQVSVNGGEPETVYFRNTYSWDSYRTVEVLVTLQEGDNTIRFYNDNSYQFSSLVNSTAPVISNLTVAALTGDGSVTAQPGASTAEIDTSRLESKLAEYADRQPYEVVYTTDSWAAVEEAAEAAQAVLEDADATQSEINKAAADLSDALDLLTEVSVPVTEEDLVAYYSFDGTLENSVDGSTAEVVGAYAYSTGGTASYTTGATSDSGSAYELTGTNGLKMDNPLTGEEYTVSFWLRDDNAPAYTGAVFFGDDDSQDTAWVSITPSGWLGHLGPMVWSYDNGTYYDNYNDTAQMQQGVWTHITVTADDGQATVYVNGTAICSGSVAQVVSQVENIFIGVNYWDTAIQGAIDELYIYDKAMSADEVAALYEGNAPTTPEVNKNELLEAMLQASQLDTGSATENQQANLLAAMETASAVYLDDSATQDQVDEATQVLRAAIAALESVENDLNGDGVVDVLDVMTLAQYVVGARTDITPQDLTGDGVINVLDVMALAQIVNGSV